jgi:DNA-binding NarL/FixJ family response regulator
MRWPRRAYTVHILLYGAALALLSLLLAWLDFRSVAQGWSGSFGVLVLAVGFVALGVWAGNRLAPRAPPSTFTRNEAALRELGISPRELEVLESLAEGAPNKVIARRLAISPNTVKTHVARLLEKLSAANRTEAIARARSLRLVP